MASQNSVVTYYLQAVLGERPVEDFKENSVKVASKSKPCGKGWIPWDHECRIKGPNTDPESDFFPSLESKGQDLKDQIKRYGTKGKNYDPKKKAAAKLKYKKYLRALRKIKRKLSSFREIPPKWRKPIGKKLNTTKFKIKEIQDVVKDLEKNVPPKNKEIHKLLLEAVDLFTSKLYFSKVRNPESFKGSKFKTKEELERANELIRVLSSVPREGIPPMKGAKSPLGPGIHRGVNVPEEILGTLREGNSYDIGPMTSWSQNYTTGKRFSKGAFSQVLFHIPCEKVKRGSHIGDMSQYKKESEFVTGGKLKISSIKKQGDLIIIYATQD